MFHYLEVENFTFYNSDNNAEAKSESFQKLAIHIQNKPQNTKDVICVFNGYFLSEAESTADKWSLNLV
jgi:hypothetical protein